MRQLPYVMSSSISTMRPKSRKIASKQDNTNYIDLASHQVAALT